MNDCWVLMQKFLMNQISDAENEALQDWLNKDLKNRQKFEEVKQVWALSRRFDEPAYELEEEKQKVFENIKNYEKPLKWHKRSYQFKILNSLMPAAAIIFLIIATAYLTWIYADSTSGSNSFGQILVSHESVGKIDLPDSSSI